MKSNGLLIVMVAATLGLTAFVAIDRHEPASDAELVSRFDAVEERLDGVEQLLRQINEREERVLVARGSAPSAANGGNPAVGEGAEWTGVEAAEAEKRRVAEFEAEVTERLESAVAEKMERLAARNMYRSEDGKWKPPMSEITREFGLSEKQEVAMREVFDDARDELFDVLSTERDDGGDVLTDFAADIRKTGDFGGAIQRFFGKLVTDKVPGRDETYLQIAAEIEERTLEDAETQLGSADRPRFRELKVDVFEVETGYDPIGKFIEDYLVEGEESG